VLSVASGDRMQATDTSPTEYKRPALPTGCGEVDRTHERGSRAQKTVESVAFLALDNVASGLQDASAVTVGHRRCQVWHSQLSGEGALVHVKEGHDGTDTEYLCFHYDDEPHVTVSLPFTAVGFLDFSRLFLYSTMLQCRCVITLTLTAVAAVSTLKLALPDELCLRVALASCVVMLLML
jgi:hypothetical protein